MCKATINYDRYVMMDGGTFYGINFDNKVLALKQHPYVTDCGEYYVAAAYNMDDPDDDNYKVYWEVTDFDTENEDETCDWDKPYVDVRD